MATGFEHGMSEWNRTHANIIRANQGAAAAKQAKKAGRRDKQRLRIEKAEEGRKRREDERRKESGFYGDKDLAELSGMQADVQGKELDNKLKAIENIAAPFEKVLSVGKSAQDFIYRPGQESRLKKESEARVKASGAAAKASQANTAKIKASIKDEEKKAGLLKDYKTKATEIHNILNDPDSTFTDKLEAEKEINGLSIKYSGIISGSGSRGRIGEHTFSGLNASRDSFKATEEYKLKTAAESKKATDESVLKSQLSGNAPAKAQYDGLSDTVEHATQMAKQPGPEGPKWQQIKFNALEDMKEFSHKATAMGLVEAAKVDPSAIFNPERGVIHYDEGAVYANPETGEPYVNSVTGEPLRRRVMNWGMTKPKLMAAIAEEERKAKTVTTLTEGVGGLPGTSITTSKPIGEPLNEEQQAEQLLGLGAAGGRGPTESRTTQTRQPTETTQTHGEPMFPGSTKTMQDFWNVDDLMERHATGGDRIGASIPESAYSEMMQTRAAQAAASPPPITPLEEGDTKEIIGLLDSADQIMQENIKIQRTLGGKITDKERKAKLKQISNLNSVYSDLLKQIKRGRKELSPSKP